MRFCTSIKLLFAVLTQIVLLSAQTYQGRILGTVTDPSGAVVASATITVTDVAKNISRTLITNRDGEYVAPDLDPGTYAVSAEAPGFKKTESKSVILEVSRDVQVNLRLSPGAVNETCCRFIPECNGRRAVVSNRLLPTAIVLTKTISLSTVRPITMCITANPW
jgi:hypothetical protein